MLTHVKPVAFALALSGALVAPSGADQHQHAMTQETVAPGPHQGGQAAFAAIGEIVKILDADPATDWSRVNLEALRAHLVDMDLVTLRARVSARPVDGGLAMDITGDGDVAAAITRMVVPHASMLDAMSTWHAAATPLTGGVRLTVTAERADDPAVVTRIRGLGFAGLLVQGDHHTAHHLMLAKGQGHGHDTP